MRQWKRYVFITFLCSLIFLILSLIIGSCIKQFVSSRKTAECFFEDDKTLLKTVANYLEQYEENWLITAEKPYHKIEDEAVVAALGSLFDEGYLEIGKNGHTIFFVRWMRWKDFSAGIAYVTDLQYKPNVDYIKHFEPLSQDGWFYYETE